MASIKGHDEHRCSLTQRRRGITRLVILLAVKSLFSKPSQADAKREALRSRTVTVIARMPGKENTDGSSAETRRRSRPTVLTPFVNRLVEQQRYSNSKVPLTGQASRCASHSPSPASPRTPRTPGGLTLCSRTPTPTTAPPSAELSPTTNRKPTYRRRRRKPNTTTPSPDHAST